MGWNETPQETEEAEETARRIRGDAAVDLDVRTTTALDALAGHVEITDKIAGVFRTLGLGWRTIGGHDVAADACLEAGRQLVEIRDELAAVHKAAE